LYTREAAPAHSAIRRHGTHTAQEGEAPDMAEIIAYSTAIVLAD
jgi:hypothetical protein